MERLLNIEGLSIDYRTGRGSMQALRNVSFGVRRKSVLGIVGESGSGKSTVLWSVLGLLADNADVREGRIDFGGRDLLSLSEKERRAVRGEQISVVFQDPMTSQAPLLKYATQMRDILYRRNDMTPAQKRDASIKMLDRVGIPDASRRIDQYPHEFSGGMRQRAGIGMALITGPKLLLADEPTTALDVTMEAQIIHQLQQLQKEAEATVVVVSHNLGLIAELCDDVVVMYAGEVVETGNVREIFHHARHPYTQALLECDPARILHRSPRLPVIAGDMPDLTLPRRGCIFAERCPHAIPVCTTQTPPDVMTESGAVARCHLLTDAKAGRPTRAGAAAWNIPAKNVAGQPLLEVDRLNVRFKVGSGLLSGLGLSSQTKLDAVLDASLRLHAGETLGLVGESGSGKTTLGRAILRLAMASGGTIRFDGEDVQSLPERRFKPLRRHMAMMFQDPVGSLSPRKTVQTLMVEPLIIHGVTSIDLDREALRLADMVRLPRSLLSRYPHQISGGQARRVGVARALALNPKLIIADEPTAGLDVSVQGEILNLMADLQAEHGLSYLIITHNLPVVRHISDRLAIMYLGRIVEQGRAEDLFNAPRHPYTEVLVRGVPQPDPDLRRTHAPIPGEVPSLLNRPHGCEFSSRCPFAKPLCREVKPQHQTDPHGRSFACHFPLSGRNHSELHEE